MDLLQVSQGIESVKQLQTSLRTVSDEGYDLVNVRHNRDIVNQIITLLARFHRTCNQEIIGCLDQLRRTSLATFQIYKKLTKPNRKVELLCDGEDNFVVHGSLRCKGNFWYVCRHGALTMFEISRAKFFMLSAVIEGSEAYMCFSSKETHLQTAKLAGWQPTPQAAFDVLGLGVKRQANEVTLNTYQVFIEYVFRFSDKEQVRDQCEALVTLNTERGFAECARRVINLKTLLSADRGASPTSGVSSETESSQHHLQESEINERVADVGIPDSNPNEDFEDILASLFAQCHQSGLAVGSAPPRVSAMIDLSLLENDDFPMLEFPEFDV